MKKCNVCQKNIAVMYTSQYKDGKQEMQGICMSCAKKLNIPIMDELLKQMNMSPDEMENLSHQMQEMMENQDPEELENNPLFGMMNGMSDDHDDEDEDAYADEDDVEVMDENPAKESQQESKKRKKRKTLDKYGDNLNDKAASGSIDRVVGRAKEIERMMHILNRRTKNNPVLVGDPGVGKTAIAEGLAMRIVEGDVPEKLLDAEIYLLDLTAIVAGTQFRGQFEGRMKAIIKEAKDSGNVILVIDEIHNIMGAGEVHGGVMNAANILKPALAKGEVQIIGATTMEEYRKHIEKDAALERRFQPILVDEPSIEESIQILKGIKKYYETYHHVEISDEVVEAAVRMSSRYVADRYLPDKAIDVIDEAGAMVNLRNDDIKAYKRLEKKLKEVIELKEQASIHDEFEKAAQYKVEEVKLQAQFDQLKKSAEHHQMTLEDIAYVIESWTKIPVRRITEEEASKLIQLEARLHHRVIGQNDAVSRLSRSIRRSRAGFKKRKKPASFIFVGPTGVGKTELAKTLAEELFGSEEAMIRLDMSEFMEKHTVSKLIGAPPGYVGYDQGGQLTEKIRRKPFSVILMDEIEKAHPDVFNMLLQILEDGRLTDSQGRTVFFENAVIIMTSNAGTNIKSGGIGFGASAQEKMHDKAKNALKEFFRPEFLNRVDEIVVFDQLTDKDMIQIVDLQIQDVFRDTSEKGMTLNISDDVKAFLATKGYDQQYGARPLRREIQRLIEDEIAEMFLRGDLKQGDALRIGLDPQTEKLIFTVG